MARIILSGSTATPVSRNLLILASSIIAAKQSTDRLLAVINQITNTGAQKANLETSAESLVPVGNGAAIYDGVVSIQTALSTLSTLVSAIDQGS